ncbi:unnamed protein product, partial [Symbiodinium sp. KB8]
RDIARTIRNSIRIKYPDPVVFVEQMSKQLAGEASPALTPLKLEEILRNCNIRTTRGEVEALIRMLDKDRSGTITKAEFLEFLSGQLHPSVSVESMEEQLLTKAATTAMSGAEGSPDTPYIIDIEISSSPARDAELARNMYKKTDISLNAGNA